MENQENYNIQLNKIKRDDVESLCNSVKDSCNLKTCQLYNPIMSQFMKFYNNKYSHNAFTFKSKYTIISIETHRQAKNKRDSYKGIIVKNYNNQKPNHQWKNNVFIKINPLLEVYPFMKNKYNTHSLLPNIFNYLTTCKLNSINNSGYLEAFCNMMLSWLTENGKCPSFPYYYGTLTGLSNEFKYDITDEYKELRKTKWFKEYNNKIYTIEKESDFDNLEEYDEDYLPNFSFNSSMESSDYDLENRSSSLKAHSSVDLHEYDDSESEEETLIKVMDLDKSNVVESVETVESSSDEDSNDETSSGSSEEDSESDSDSSEESDEEEEVKEELKDDKKSDEEEIKNQLKNLEEKINIKLDDNKLDDNKLDSEESDTNVFKVDDISDIDEDLIKENDVKSDDKSVDNGDLKIIPGLNEDDFLMDATYNVVIPDFPVQVICMESLDITLDEYLSKYKMCQDEWLSVIFQICFGLSVAQKHFALTHNDLHGNNIMFKKTGLKFMYFNVEGMYYQIPTFQKITKIIDFTRSVFEINDKLYFSDVFRKEGDAEGQYSYPYKNDLDKCYNKPNKSFDLARLATTIAHYFDEKNEIYHMLLEWMTDKYGNNLGDETDSFDLYIKIARGVKNAVPKEQLIKPIFRRFQIEKDDIPESGFIYYF